MFVTETNKTETVVLRCRDNGSYYCSITCLVWTITSFLFCFVSDVTLVRLEAKRKMRRPFPLGYWLEARGRIV